MIVVDIIAVIVFVICLFVICKQERKIKRLKLVIDYAAKEDSKNQGKISGLEAENEHLYEKLKKYQEMVEKSKSTVRKEVKEIIKKSEEKPQTKRGRKSTKKKEQENG